MYLLGQILTVAGIAMFLLTFVLFAANFGNFSNFQGQIRTKMLLAVGGIVLIMIGQALKGVGRYGKAGSGIILDPEQERKDREPVNRSLGGQIADMLDDANIGNQLGSREVIKIRCPHCKALNDETDKFCGQCGQALV